MKKYISLLLLAAALLTACSSDGEVTEETLPANDDVIEEIEETEAESETEVKIPESVDVFEYHTLELSKEPVWEDGVLVLYFTEDDLWFETDSSFYIGLRSEDEAYSVSAVSETALYPDMLVEDEYCGIALRPSEEIPAGEYRMSVTFEHYICDFEMTIQ